LSQKCAGKSSEKPAEAPEAVIFRRWQERDAILSGREIKIFQQFFDGKSGE
jgi:hypothetical protein